MNGPTSGSGLGGDGRGWSLRPPLPIRWLPTYFGSASSGTDPPCLQFLSRRRSPGSAIVFSLHFVSLSPSEVSIPLPTSPNAGVVKPNRGKLILEPVSVRIKATRKERKELHEVSAKSGEKLGIAAVLTAGLVVGLSWLPTRGAADAKQANSVSHNSAAQAGAHSGTHSTAAAAVNGERVVRYIRERFGIAGTVKVSVGSIENSAISGYYKAVIATDDGKAPQSKNILVSKDGHYLVIAETFALGADPKTDIEKAVRTAFKLPDNVQLSVGPSRKSSYPSLNQLTVSAEQNGQKKSEDFYVDSNQHTFVLGAVFDMNVNPYTKAKNTIKVENQPAVGAPGAPVTIVEYADLECPMCANYQKYFDSQLLPKYGSKIRLVFKDYPLPMHDWSKTAAVANQCAYQMKPSSYHPYRSLIFQNQSGINASNVRDRLLELGEQAGLDRLKLAACVDAQQSWPRIKEDVDEASALGVQGTPTFFVNGHMIYGVMPDQFDKVVDDALAAKKND